MHGDGGDRTQNGANTAGGLSGQNKVRTLKPKLRAATGQRQPAAGAAVPLGGSIYRDSAPADVVNRAANQQQSAEIAASRAKAQAMKSCYVERGYREFTLTPEQRAKLGSLQPGSNAYLQYLAEIGADASVVNAQSAK